MYNKKSSKPMISRKMMMRISCGNLKKMFSQMRKNGFKKDLLARPPWAFFHVYIINTVSTKSYGFSRSIWNSFAFVLKCTRRSSSCNFSFLTNSLVQINSKLNDYLYKVDFYITQTSSSFVFATEDGCWSSEICLSELFLVCY